jgi:hypothetical protein
MPLADVKRLNKLCHQTRTKMIACAVNGVCGMIFDDFLDDFEVVDVEGETHKDVPLSTAEYDDGPTGSGRMSVSCIEEEKLGVGLEDQVEISWTRTLSNDQADSTAAGIESRTFAVTKVANIRSIEIDVGTTDRSQLDQMISAVSAGRATIKKVMLLSIG